MALALPSLGAIARTSQVGALISPRTSALIINALIPAVVAAFIDVWLNKAGLVSTLAGSDVGYLNATGTAALFRFPAGVAVLPNGNIVVTDSGNNLIRLVTSLGVVTTLAGGAGGTTAGSANGTGTAATFSFPWGVGVLPDGNIVVADAGNHRIRLITPV
jgi:hypothetical protein